jgi:hypothetical protein
MVRESDGRGVLAAHGLVFLARSRSRSRATNNSDCIYGNTQELAIVAPVWFTLNAITPT